MRVRALLVAGLLAGVTPVVAAHDLYGTARTGRNLVSQVHPDAPDRGAGLDYISQRATVTFSVKGSPGKAR